MSISFFIVGAPGVEAETSCLCAQMAPRFCAHFDGDVTLDEVRDELREHASDACLSCKGTGVIVEEQLDDDSEVNFSCDNARVMLRLMGLDASGVDHGKIEIGDIPLVLRGLIKAENSAGTRGAFVKEPVFIEAVQGGVYPVNEGNVTRLERGAGSAAFYEGGRTDEQILRSVRRLVSLFHKAQAVESAVYWS